MNYKGSCHCGQIAFEVEGSLEQAMECNCSHCSRKGYLLWFVPRPQFKLNTPEEDLVTYTFQQARHQASFLSEMRLRSFRLRHGSFGSGNGGDQCALLRECRVVVTQESAG